MNVPPDCPMCKFFPTQLYYYYQPVPGGPILVKKDKRNEKRKYIKSN